MEDSDGRQSGVHAIEPRQAPNDRAGALPGWALLTASQRGDIEAHVRGLTEEKDTYEAPPHGWCCFHCGETFKTYGGARLHFGTGVTDVPVCTAVAIRGAITSNVQVQWGGRGIDARFDFVPASIDRAVRAILKASSIHPDAKSAPVVGEGEEQ